ncbi:MAG: hypothetical protein M4D80_14975 [Myxococcota bacterium]|nr:hypothetical protein [Myxococcota bacterium]
MFGSIGRIYALEHAQRVSATRHLGLVFGAIGRLYAIKRGLGYDLRVAKRVRPDVVVPREVFEAVMRAWYLARGMDAALATHDWDASAYASDPADGRILPA